MAPRTRSQTKNKTSWYYLPPEIRGLIIEQLLLTCFDEECERSGFYCDDRAVYPHPMREYYDYESLDLMYDYSSIDDPLKRCCRKLEFVSHSFGLDDCIGAMRRFITKLSVWKDKQVAIVKRLEAELPARPSRSIDRNDPAWEAYWAWDTRLTQARHYQMLCDRLHAPVKMTIQSILFNEERRLHRSVEVPLEHHGS